MPSACIPVSFFSYFNWLGRTWPYTWQCVKVESLPAIHSSHVICRQTTRLAIYLRDEWLYNRARCHRWPTYRYTVYACAAVPPCRWVARCQCNAYQYCCSRHPRYPRTVLAPHVIISYFLAIYSRPRPRTRTYWCDRDEQLRLLVG
jgi:hypothetical protein